MLVSGVTRRVTAANSNRSRDGVNISGLAVNGLVIKKKKKKKKEKKKVGGGGGEEHESNFKSTKTVNDKVTYWPRLSHGISNNSVSCQSVSH